MEYDRIRDNLGQAGAADDSIPHEDTSAEPKPDSTDTAPPANGSGKRRRSTSSRKRAKQRRSDSHQLGPDRHSAAERHLARQQALLALYELDVTTHDYDSVIARIVRAPFMESDEPADDDGASADDGSIELDLEVSVVPPELEASRERVRQLVLGVVQNVESLDATITAAAPAFPIERIATVDRNVLRLGVYELRFEPDVPPFAAINEAVELAKRFGGESSGRFANGVLRTISERITNERDLHASPGQSEPNPDESIQS